MPGLPPFSLFPLESLPLPIVVSTLSFIWAHRVKHDLILSVLSIGRVTFTPVIADSVGKDTTVPAESRAGDGPSNSRVTLEAVFGVLVPEVEGTVASSSAEGAMDGMETD